MVTLNSNYYTSVADYEKDRARFKSFLKQDSTGFSYLATGFGGKPDWTEVLCVSCGTNHGVSAFNESGECEVVVMRKNNVLHKLFFERFSKNHDRKYA